jgi:hypothetical protein
MVNILLHKIDRHKCAWRDLVVHQRINANGFLLHMIYSPEPNNQGKILDYIDTFVIIIQQSKDHYFTVLHNLCMMGSWCRTESVWLSSWFPHGRLVSSAAADQLLILLPTGRARSPLRLFTHGDPIYLRVHALLIPPVCYNKEIQVLKTSQPQPNPTAGKWKEQPSTNRKQRIHVRDNVKQILIGHIYNTDFDCSKSEENTQENGKWNMKAASGNTPQPF